MNIVVSLIGSDILIIILLWNALSYVGNIQSCKWDSVVTGL